MDFIPDLGEPGIFDELIYFGPLVLLAVLFGVFFWFMGRWDPESSWVGRGIVASGLALISTFFLIIFLVVFVGGLFAG